MTTLYPLLLNPALHVKVWGGRKLENLLHKALPTSEPYGESWELHDTATVANGALAGQSLGEVLRQFGHDLIGPQNDPAEGFPLLAKFLDAQDWLSVQVHPNDAQARELEGDPRGKTEAWYVLAADPGSTLVKGIQPGTSPAAMAEAIRANQLEPLLVYQAVEAGDVLLNNAGGVHALGPGIVIYEIQQSSDVTYRLYDWGRMDLDGKPRTLHIEKGVHVSNLTSVPDISATGANAMPVVDVVHCPYFVTLLHQLNARNGTAITLDTRGVQFHALTCIGGAAEVVHANGTVAMGLGQTVLVPAALGAYTLRGTARVLRSFQPVES
jgi:mannose-6-phosphate isomerase